MLKIGICGSDETQISILKQMIGKNEIMIDVDVIETFTGEHVVNEAKKTDLDVVFLDIQLGNENGIDVARKLNGINKDCIIAFIAASKEHAFEAYDVNPITYILKPLTEEKFKSCILLIKERFDEKQAYRESNFDLTFKYNRKVVKLKFSDILFFEKSLQKIRIHTKNKIYEYYGSFKHLKSIRGYDAFFIQCHQGFIVNKRKIIEYTSDEILLDGTASTIPVSRGLRQMVKVSLDNCMNVLCKNYQRNI